MICARARHRGQTALASALTAATVSGCSLAPDSSAAEQAAVDFHAAVDSGDGVAACDMLAAATADEVSSAGDAPCARALESLDLPSAGGPQDVAAFVISARVRLAGDVVFVAEVEDRWLVVAAGCERQPDDSYDCTVKGG